MATAARELMASGATAAMAMSDGYGSLLAAAHTAALGTAVARTREVGGSEQGKSVTTRTAALRALVFQRQRGRQSEGIWFWFVRCREGRSVGGFVFLRGVGGVGDGSSDGNGRWQRQTVSGGTDGGVRDCGGKGDGGRRKRSREVSGREGGCMESFGLSAVQVSEIVIMVCYGCNLRQTM